MDKFFTATIKLLGLVLTMLGCSMAIGFSRNLVRDVYCHFQQPSTDWCLFSDLPLDRSILTMLALLFGCVLFNVRMRKLGLRNMFRAVGAVWMIVLIALAAWYIMPYLKVDHAP